MALKHVIDMERFEQCARVVSIVNPRFGYQGLLERMLADARNQTEPGFIGTAGYYVTAFIPHGKEDELHFLPTVMPYTVQRFLDGEA